MKIYQWNNETSETRVLVADENPMSRFLTRKMLEGLGYRVDAVEKQTEAVEAARGNHYGVIFMHFRKPEGGGMTTVHQLRTVDGARVPVIASTQYTDHLSRKTCQEAGFDDVLCKPAQAAQYADLMNRWLAPVAA